MKPLHILVVVLAFTVTAAEQKDEDLAATVIRSEVHAGYNPLDNSEAELIKAATINSALRLQYIMLHEVRDPEVRVCYALRVLESQIASARRIVEVSGNESGRSQEYLDMLQKRQTELARQFREIQKRKAEPGGPANGSQPIRSETNRTPSAAGSRR